MSNAYKSELDQKLAEAEQAALPLVHAAMTHEPMRAAFPTELAHRLRAAGADGAGARRPRVHLAWRWRGLSPARAGIAVALATTLVVVGGILYPRLTSTSAAAVLDGIQREAGATPGGITFTTNGAARSCPPAGGPITSAGSARGATTGAVVAAVSNPGVGTPQPGTPVAGARVVSIAFPGSPPPGKATGGAQVVSIGGPGSPEDEIGPASVNPTEVSDRLGQALGVSGQRVRDAMRQALDSVDPPPALPDPIAGLAQQLGKTREEVESAFTNPDCPEAGAVISVTFPVTADQLSGPAQRLGVTPDRLAAALRAVLPPPTGKPPSEEELIHRMAADLGVSDAQLRAAITKVEGPDRAYFFSIPLPSLGKP